jgi:hypothetical protein
MMDSIHTRKGAVRQRSRDSFHCLVPAGLLLGFWLTLFFSTLESACAADPPYPASWTAWGAERVRLHKQFQQLVAERKTNEAMAVAEKLIAVDRQILDLRAPARRWIDSRR